MVKQLATILLAGVLIGCSTVPTRMPENDLFCPVEGLAERPEKPNPPPKDYQAFKRWAAELNANYLLLHNADSILLQCWKREAAKRATPSE